MTFTLELYLGISFAELFLKKINKPYQSVWQFLYYHLLQRESKYYFSFQ